MFINGFGQGWKPAGWKSQKHADKHGWAETNRNSCGDPIMYSRGHTYEYLSYTYDAGHTHESAIVKRRIKH